MGTNLCHLGPATKTFRVPTAPGKPGKMMKGFPVMEIWNFEILQNIMEK